jgi:hypothetical protein
VKFTLPHYYDFGGARRQIGRDLVRPDAWDAARETTGPFGLPATRDAWEQAASADSITAKAADIVSVTRSLGGVSICSYGVGSALLELSIAKQGLRVICTDFAPRTVERLRALFPEAQVVAHDIRLDDPPLADLHLMHRIDSELSTEAWLEVFPRFAQPILVVPTILLNVRRAGQELALRVLRPKATRAGWVRSEDALRALWLPTHRDVRVTVGGVPAFLLTRRHP